MTHEQRAEKVLDSLAEGSHLDDLAVKDFLALKAAIAAALKPSEAVRELYEAAQGAIPELCGREDVHDDPHGQYTRNKMRSWHVDGYDNGRTSQSPCPSNAIRVALAAVRKELGL